MRTKTWTPSGLCIYSYADRMRAVQVCKDMGGTFPASQREDTVALELSPCKNKNRAKSSSGWLAKPPSRRERQRAVPPLRHQPQDGYVAGARGLCRLLATVEELADAHGTGVGSPGACLAPSIRLGAAARSPACLRMTQTWRVPHCGGAISAFVILRCDNTKLCARSCGWPSHTAR